MMYANGDVDGYWETVGAPPPAPNGYQWPGLWAWLTGPSARAIEDYNRSMAEQFPHLVPTDPATGEPVGLIPAPGAEVGATLEVGAAIEYGVEAAGRAVARMAETTGRALTRLGWLAVAGLAVFVVLRGGGGRRG